MLIDWEIPVALCMQAQTPYLAFARLTICTGPLMLALCIGKYSGKLSMHKVDMHMHDSKRVNLHR